MLNIKRFRRVQTILSIFIFLLVFLGCWDVTKFKIENIQLSYWGVENKFGWIWNSCVAILAMSMCYNVYCFIDSHPRIQFKKTLQKLFFLVFIALFLTGIIDMHHKPHNVTAFFYFFAYPMAIFIFAHLNRKLLQYKEWLTHVCISVSMVIIPLILIKLFHGMAIAESIHGVIAIIWNLWILMDD